MISFISAMPLIATNKKDYRGFVHSRDYKASNFIGHVFCNIEKDRITKKRVVCMRHTGRKEEERKAVDSVLLVIIRLKGRKQRGMWAQ